MEKIINIDDIKICAQCSRTQIGKICICGNEFEEQNKTQAKQKAEEAEEEYYKPLSAKERRIRRKAGVQQLKKLVNELPKVFRNTHLWKKYGEINNE